MNIHHATVKKAAKYGIVLSDASEAAGRDMCEAWWPAYNHKVQMPDPKYALELMVQVQNNIEKRPGLHIATDDGVILYQGVLNGILHTFLEANWPALDTDIVDAARVAGVDLYKRAASDTPAPEAKPEPKPEPKAPAKPKPEPKPKKNTKPLATFIDAQGFKSKDGFDFDGFEAFLIANGVEVDPASKWAGMKGDPAAAGRYRMIGGIKLAKAVEGKTKVLDAKGKKHPNPLG